LSVLEEFEVADSLKTLTPLPKYFKISGILFGPNNTKIHKIIIKISDDPIICNPLIIN
tara:strand:+ start:434 stop:607 length:174 start_codon:yes stop_codon:yes gene_type:complete